MQDESANVAGQSGVVDGASVRALRAVLGQLRRAIERLDDGLYIATGRTAVEGAVGGHVRHCLDHVRALIHGAATGVVDYDRRDRGGPVETRRATAIRSIERLDEALASLAGRADRALRLRCVVDAAGTAATVETTLGREVAFVLSHTVHHQALIAGIIRGSGGGVEAGFGVAPATLANRQGDKAADVHGNGPAPGEWGIPTRGQSR